MIDRQMNTSLFDYDRYVYVDADAVAKECGAVMEESEAFGQKFTHTKWDGEVLRKVLKKIEPDLHGNKVAKDLETGKMPACGSIRLPQADSQE